MSVPINKRLASLDVLRGFDLFMLVGLQPVVWQALSQVHAPWADAILYQLDHEVWAGFRCWDLVMPLFLFMCGAALPYSMSRFVSGELPKALAWRKIARRFIILFLLGMVVQGNLLGLVPADFKIYTNTLQAIAAGYVIAAAMVLHLRWRGQVVAVIALLAAYSIPMALTGGCRPEGNLANTIDATILGHFRGDPSYTWIWSSLTFGVTTMLGAWAGQFVRSHRESPQRTALHLFLIGVGLIVLGLVWSLGEPIVKRIWTSSMTLYAGGWSWVLLSLFYYVIDVRGWHRPFDWLKVYGMNAITAYMLGEVVSFKSVAKSLFYGFEPLTGPYYDAVIALGNAAVIYLILWALYRSRVFIKI